MIKIHFKNGVIKPSLVVLKILVGNCSEIDKELELFGYIGDVNNTTRCR